MLRFMFCSMLLLAPEGEEAGGGDGSAGESTAGPNTPNTPTGAPTSSGPVGTATGAPIATTPEEEAPSEEEAAAKDKSKGGESSPVMSQEALNDRIARAKRAEEERHRKFLKETFGTDDPEEVKKARARMKELEENEEKRKRAAMSEQQRMQADLEKERKEKETLRQQLQQEREERMHTQQNQVITGIAAKHIDPEYIEDVNIIFARHLKSLSEKELDSFDQRKIEKWYADFAKKKPAFARQAGEPPAPPTKKPVTTGPAPRGKPAPTSTDGAGGNAKTAAPGKPNSMSKQEVRAFMNQKGLNPY